MTLNNFHNHDETVKLFTYQKPMELFATKKYVKICAPMVRYTK